MRLPPPAADDGPIDLEHLRQSTLGNSALKQLVSQSRPRVWSACLQLCRPRRARSAAHAEKGSAGAISALFDRSSELEATIRDGGDQAQALTEFDAAVAEVARAMLSRP